MSAAVFSSEQTSLAIVGVDAVSLCTEDVISAREQAARLCAVPAENILIAASHTHTGGPANDVLGTPSDANYRQHIVQRITSAIALAYQRRVPCELGYGVGEAAGLAWNRRWVLRDGSQATHANPSSPDVIGRAGPDDSQVTLLAARGLDGRMLGFVGNFTCHCTLRGGREFSADYPGALSEGMLRLTGAPLVFLSGAMGDLTQVNRDVGFDHPLVGQPVIARFANKLAGESAKLLADMHFSRNIPLGVATDILSIPFRVPDPNQLRDDELVVASAGRDDYSREIVFARERLLLRKYIESHETARCEVKCLCFGNLAIAASPGQMFCALGLAIKEQSPFEATMVASIANGNIGYVPTVEAIEKGGYESALCRGSRSAADAGDRIVASSERLLQSLHASVSAHG